MPETTWNRIGEMPAALKNYRIEDFALCFAVSKRTVWELIARGEIEALKIGRRTVITAESAQAWRDRCPRVSPSKKSGR
jgi:excisionase family DNA binding protein